MAVFSWPISDDDLTMRISFASAFLPAATSALVVAAVGAIGFIAGQPWLFPSLGPTMFIMATAPEEHAARPWNTFVGHAIGVAAGFGALFLFSAQETPSVFAADALSASRVAATALAVGATILLQSLADARHPPAAATTMLITLGGVKPAWGTVATIAVGVTLVAGLAGAVRSRVRWRREAAFERPEMAKQSDPEPGR